MSYWKRGQKAFLARQAGVSAAFLCDVLHRRRVVSLKKAKLLAELSIDLFGYEIPWTAWVNSTDTKHPAFGKN